jgi:hypothetical protein
MGDPENEFAETSPFATLAIGYSRFVSTTYLARSGMEPVTKTAG